MARYRSKRTEVDAVRWFPGRSVLGVQSEEVWAEICGRGHGTQRFKQPDRHYVTTIRGQKAYLEPGDYVITELDGIHHYPCKADIFEARYEPVPE